MSAKITLGSTLGGLVLLIIIGVVVITGSKANEEAALEAKKNSEAAKIISEQNYNDLKQMNKTVTTFIENWEKRVQVSNKVQNSTQDKIERGVQNVIGNLTQHRIIQNITREDDEQRQNETLQAIKHIQNITSALTGEEYKKLSDQRVNTIISNLSADHQLLFEALNISKTDKTTDAEQLGQLVKQLLEAQKDKKLHEPEGSRP